MDTSTQVTVQILNAFVNNNSGGNPAGVVLNADNLSHKQKLHIAKKVGLSETAFVSSSKTEDFKLEFFTPKKQIPHCGHATIATFSYLKQIGRLNKNQSSKETIDGARQIKLIDDLAFMEQLAPKYSDVTDKEDYILKSLGLTKTDLIPNAPIKIVNTGNSFLIIPVKNSTILKRITPDFDLISTISNELDLIGYYVFTTDVNHELGDATSRMFAPSYGIEEESATGMAAGPLACYLFDVLTLKKERFFIRQGEFMPKPSSSMIIIDLFLKQNTIKSLMVGGKGMSKKHVKITI